MILDEPKHTAESLAAKIAIRIYELRALSKQDPSPDIFERIKLKEQLLKELREYLTQKGEEGN